MRKHGLHAPEFDIYGTVSLLRKQRVAMVQTKDQYVFVYKAILDLVRNVLSGVENTPPEGATVAARKLCITQKGWVLASGSEEGRVGCYGEVTVRAGVRFFC